MANPIQRATRPGLVLDPEDLSISLSDHLAEVGQLQRRLEKAVSTMETLAEFGKAAWARAEKAEAEVERLTNA